MQAAKRSMATHVQAMLDFSKMGVPTFDYGNNIRQMAKEMGVENAFDFHGFVPAYIRPLFCRGIGPFRWVALSGDPQDIYKTDAKVKEIVADDKHLHHWLDMARERINFEGLPARICWVGLGGGKNWGWRLTKWCAAVKSPRLSSLDVTIWTLALLPAQTVKPKPCATVLDAVSGLALLNALLITASGATRCRCTTAAGSAWASRNMRGW